MYVHKYYGLNWPFLANYLDFDQYLKIGQLSLFWPTMANRVSYYLVSYQNHLSYSLVLI